MLCEVPQRHLLSSSIPSPSLVSTKFSTSTPFPAPSRSHQKAGPAKNLAPLYRVYMARAITLKYKVLPFIWGDRQIFKVFKFCSKGESFIVSFEKQSFCYSAVLCPPSVLLWLSASNILVFAISLLDVGNNLSPGCKTDTRSPMPSAEL